MKNLSKSMISSTPENKIGKITAMKQIINRGVETHYKVLQATATFMTMDRHTLTHTIEIMTSRFNSILLHPQRPLCEVVNNHSSRQVVVIIKATILKISTLENALHKIKHIIIKQIHIALEVRRAQSNPSITQPSSIIRLSIRTQRTQ